jgi:formamidopyrimidine-DNA glycosylase
MHLGMSGSFHVFRKSGDKALGRYYHERAKHAAHDHVVFHMSSGAIVTFNDPRRFGSMKIVAREKLDAEPLLQRGSAPSRSATPSTPAMLAAACKGKKTSLKAALLDQRVVAGLGNIYVCEALHRARLSPTTHGLDHRDQNRRGRTSAPSVWSRASRRCSTMRSRPAARRCAITSARRRSRPVPAPFPRLRPRGRKMPDARLPRHRQAHRAEWALDVLLSGVPEVKPAKTNPG